MSMFDIHIAKLGRAIGVNLPNEEALVFHAAHGLKQRLNDATASLKRSGFETDDDYENAVETAVMKVHARIEAGTIGTRAPTAAPKVDKRKVTEYCVSMSDAELDEMWKAVEAARKAKSAEPVAEAA